jgi:hypothetical protein
VEPGAELDGVLTALDELLVNCGYADKAAWIRRRRDRLRDPAAAEEREMVAAELQRVVHGEGGLAGLALHPSRVSGLTPDGARHQFDTLADRIAVLTAGDAGSS